MQATSPGLPEPLRGLRSQPQCPSKWFSLSSGAVPNPVDDPQCTGSNFFAGFLTR